MTTNTTARRSAEHTRVLLLTALAEAATPLTVTDLADRAGVAKSTVSRHLPVLERDGEAARTPGGRNGRRRLPDQWTLTATTSRDNDTQETAPTDPVAEAAPAPAPAPPEDAAGPDTGTDTDPQAADPGQGTPDSQHAPTPVTPAEEAPIATTPVPVATVRVCATGSWGVNAVSGSTRLSPGELKLMVRAILDAEPGEEFTATAISHILQGRSIGAIQNNLARLAKEGHAVQTCAKPRRYQSAKHAG